jgi:hypothetical protein
MRRSLVLAVLVAASAGGGGALAAPSDSRPSLSTIQATFVESSRATDYVVSLTDPLAGPTSPMPDWKWTLEPPTDDPTCDKFGVVSTERFRSSARWRHADSDGCKHVGLDHAGRITVTVNTGTGFECTATITGTTTHEGPEANLCFKLPTATPPPPTSTSAPSLRDLEKKSWRDAATAATAAGVGFSGLAVGCALVPSPDPVTKGIALFGVVVAIGYYAYGQYAYRKAQDPPDRNYKQLAKVVVPTLPKVRAGGGVTAAEAAAANALAASIARIAGYDAALVTSFERAQGAYAARDGTWDHRQSLAAARYARAEAKLLDARPALERALRKAIESAGAPALTLTDARRATDHVARHGLSASFTSYARRLGVGGAPLAAFARAAGRAKPATIAGPVTAKVGGPAVTHAYRSSAALLRTLAARLAKR